MSIMTAYYLLGFERDETPQSIHLEYENGFERIMKTANQLYKNATGAAIDFTLANVLEVLYLESPEVLDDFMINYYKEYKTTIH